MFLSAGGVFAEKSSNWGSSDTGGDGNEDGNLVAEGRKRAGDSMMAWALDPPMPKELTN